VWEVRKQKQIQERMEEWKSGRVGERSMIGEAFKRP